MTLSEMIQDALEQGIRQVKAAGSPLHPFMVVDPAKILFLFDPSGQTEPMEMALSAIREHAPECKRVVLVLDTMLTTQDGRKSDAIVAMGSELGQETGPMWAQIYRPRRWFRRFRVEGSSRRLPKSELIREALAAPTRPGASVLRRAPPESRSGGTSQKPLTVI
jgi:hypothetical protein